MTIASEIQRIKTNIANAYDALENKGATMPATEDSANLASTVNTVSTGVSIDNTTITENSSDQLQASAVMNARTGTDVLPIWQGTEQQWTEGVSTDWYNWRTPAAFGHTSVNSLPEEQNWDASWSNGNIYIIKPSGSTNQYYYSSDGITWMLGVFPDNANWALKTTEGGKFIASADNTIITSSDGINWSITTTIYMNTISGIIYGGDKYLAWGSNGSYTAVIYSSDGVNWYEGDLSAGYVYSGFAYGAGKFVCFVYQSGGGTLCKAWYSSDGATWNQSSSNTSTSALQAITYGNNIFVVFYGDDSSSTYFTSTDGISWTMRSGLPITGIYACKFTNGVFLGSQYNSTPNNVAVYSTDGIDWTTTTLPINSSGVSILNDIFYYKFNNIFYYSYDGNTWNSITLDNSQTWGNVNANSKLPVILTSTTINAELVGYLSTSVFTDTLSPTTASTVYSAPNTASALTITSIGTGTITLSDNNTYTYTQSGDIVTYQTIGDAYPNYLANINGVGVKIGNTLIADNTDTSTLQTKSNLVTSVSSSSTDTQYPSAKLLYDTVGNIEATLDAIIAQGSNS